MNHTVDDDVASASAETGTEYLWNMSRMLPPCKPARFAHRNENNIKSVELQVLRGIKLHLCLIKHWIMKTYGTAEAQIHAFLPSWFVYLY